MCVYHAAPYTFATREERLTTVRHWPYRLEEQARLTLLNIEAVLAGFMGLVLLVALYAAAEAAKL